MEKKKRNLFLQGSESERSMTLVSNDSWPKSSFIQDDYNLTSKAVNNKKKKKKENY